MKLMMTSLLFFCFFSFPVVGFASSLLNVQGYNKGEYEKARTSVRKISGYGAFRATYETEVRKNKLRKSFYSEVEDDVLKLLVSTSQKRIKYFHAFTARLVSQKVLTQNEKKYVDQIMMSFFNGELKKARNQITKFSQHATSPAAKELAKTLLQTRDLGHALHSSVRTKGVIVLTGGGPMSTAQGRGEVIGTVVGSGIGFLSGGIGGGYIGGQIGRGIGSWLGKLFKKNPTSSDVWSPPGDGNPCDDPMSGVLC